MMQLIYSINTLEAKIRKLQSEVASPFKGKIWKEKGPEQGKRLLQIPLATETHMRLKVAEISESKQPSAILWKPARIWLQISITKR